MRSSWLAAVALSVFLGTGCDEETESKPAPPPPTTSPDPSKSKADADAEAAPEVDKEPENAADPLAEARMAAWRGEPESAAKQFGAVLDQGSGAWNGFAAAVRELDAAAAEAAVAGKGTTGDRAILLAEIKLSGGDADGALAAALEARADQPDAAAALVARAVLAGATAPESDVESDPVAALVKFVGARDARSARGVTETAEAVAGWRAALLRGEVRAGWGETDMALAEFDKAVATGDPMAIVEVNLARTKLAQGAKPRRGQKPITPVQVSQWAQAAALAAVENTDVAGFNGAMKVLVGSTEASLRYDLTAMAAAAAVEAAGGEKSTNDELRLLWATAALEAGLPSVTMEQVKLVSADSANREEIMKLGIWAAWELRDAEGLKAAGDSLSGPHGLAARALHELLAGDIGTGLRTLPTSGLSEREFVRVLIAGAEMAGGDARDWLKRAVRSADRTGNRGLRIQTRLALDRATRRHTPSAAAQTLEEVSRLVPAGDSGAALRYELSARQMLLEGRAAFPEGDLPPVVKGWRSLSEGQTVTADGPAVMGISKWAAARSTLAAAQGNTTKAFNEAVEALPLYRWGGLDAGTALDGSQGVPFLEDLALLASGEPSEDALGSALACHEVAHLLDRAVSDATVGRDLLAGMDKETRKALLDASAAVRAGMMRWHAGVDDFPLAAFEKLEAAEKAAASDSVFSARVIPSAPPPLADIRRVNNKMAILLYMVARGTVHGLVITPDGGAIKSLGDVRSFMRNIGEHATSLRASVESKARASHVGGDELRKLLSDPFMQQLSGHGLFLVLGPRELREFMFTTFPETGKALRWLADIRTVAMLDSAARINVTPEDLLDPERFRKGPDILSFGNPSAPVDDGKDEAKAEGEAKSKAKSKSKSKSKAEDEAGAMMEETPHLCTHGDEPSVNLSVAHRFFDPDFRETCVGPDAKLANYFELAPRARYIHIDAVDATDRGGFKFGDGELDLTTVRSIPLVADLVIVSADADIVQQQQRARAFLDAGAGAVLFTGWSVPEEAQERMLDGFWAAVKRDRSIARANAEGRDSLLRDALLGEEMDDPGLWGSMLLYTTP
jgi:hypothetical protein